MTQSDYPLEKAWRLANNRRELRKRLMEAKSVLTDYYRQLFKNPKFDFENKRLIGDDGFYLQWMIRYKPELPIGPKNQQTSVGCVILLNEKDGE